MSTIKEETTATGEQESTTSDNQNQVAAQETENRSSVAPESVIFQISEKTGLPESYSCSLGSIISGVSRDYNISPLNDISGGLQGTYFNWAIVPKDFSNELVSLPWEHVFGQGVLVRDCKNKTALLSIAQAAVAQLKELVPLLECLVQAMENSIRTRETQSVYQLSWKDRDNRDATARVVFAKAVDGAWAIGLESGNEPQQQLRLDPLCTLEWIHCVFSSCTDAQELIIKYPSGVKGRSRNIALADPALIIALGAENQEFSAYELHSVSSQVDLRGPGCWRKKIRGGVILGNPKEAASQSTRTPADACDDCLVLTAAALWALFDNSLHPMPNCECTLKSEGGDFLSFQKKVDGWYVWHLVDNENETCNGNVCRETGIKVPTDENAFNSLSPCILGWPAHTRSSPDVPIAQKIPLSESLQKDVCYSLSLDTVQIQAQLGWQGGVSVQGLFGVSFRMKRYTVANSIQYDSALASIVSENATVLVYCEERQLHLAMNGADILETLIMQRLKELLGEIASQVNVDGTPTDERFPRFIHPKAIERMETWRNSTFVSSGGRRIPGEVLLRDASEKITKMMNVTKSFPKRPLYWSLRDVLSGVECSGLNGPVNAGDPGWFILWKEYPILILAVGRINDQLISLASDVILESKKRKNSSLRRLFRQDTQTTRSNISGGLLAGNRLIQALLQQSSDLFPACLTRTEQHLPGNPSQPCFAIVPKDACNGHETETSVNCSTCEGVTPPSECVHYFR